MREITKGQANSFMAYWYEYSADEVGTLKLNWRQTTTKISSGDVGYLVSGIKEA